MAVRIALPDPAHLPQRNGSPDRLIGESLHILRSQAGSLRLSKGLTATVENPYNPVASQNTFNPKHQPEFPQARTGRSKESPRLARF